MSQLNYKTYSDILLDIKQNIHKLPSNIDLVVGIPRSGMIPAYMIGFALNIKVCSLDEFINQIDISHGERLLKQTASNILIVDDSMDTGASMARVKKQIAALEHLYENIFFAAIYVTNEAKHLIDIWFSILPMPRVFQWNYLNHNFVTRSCFDIDGVLCVDPGEEENDDGEKYLGFIRNAKPLYIPHYTIHALVTTRLEKYRKETEEWLRQHNVQYERLFMLDLPSKEERIRLNIHAKYKAEIYEHLTNTVLFYESSKTQAREIALLTQKAVFCVETDELIYNPPDFSTQLVPVKQQLKQQIKNAVKKVLRVIFFKKSWREKIKKILGRG
jgi:uncharacterized HAD superfamily protein